MEDNIKKMRAWIEDQARHEDIAAKADGYRACIPAFAGNKAVLDIEQMIIDVKNAILLVMIADALGNIAVECLF